MDHGRRHRRIDAARQSADDLIILADSLPDARDLFFNDRGRTPIAFASANLEKKVAQDLTAQRRMRKAQPVEPEVEKA